MRRHVLLLLFLFAAPLHAATLVVDTTSDASLSNCSADPADCSLRGAIARAELDVLEDRIHFAIPASDDGCDAVTGVCRIAPATSLPAISRALVIDGYTQPGAQPNTIPAPGANNAQIKVEVAATGSNSDTGIFTITQSAAFEASGLAMFAPGPGMIRTATGGGANTRVTLRGNWFGVDAAGQAPDYTVGGSVFSMGSFNRVILIGGPEPAHRNVIAGSGRDLNGLVGGGSINILRVNSITGLRGRILVQGNLIGLAPDGLTPLPLQNALQVHTGDDPLETPLIEILDNRFVRPPRTFGGAAGGALRFDVARTMLEPARVQGNVFGLGVDGARIGVERDHIEVFLGNGSRVPRVLVGGLGVGEGNVFAAGLAQGAGVLGSVLRLPNGSNVDSFVEIVGNTMLDSAGLGLDFPHPTQGGGVAVGRTLNDPGDVDTGSNGLQNHPDIESFSVAGEEFSVGYRVDSLPVDSAYPLRVDFYRALGDEGEVLLDSDVYESASAQSLREATLAIPPGVDLDADDVLVAVATDFGGRSSEFSFDTALLAFGPLPEQPRAGLPLEVEVIATASSGPFKPNGPVRVSINTSPAASCELELEPGVAAGTAVGRCSLVPLQGGVRTLTATLDTLRSAFASESGGNAVVATGVTLAEPGPEQLGFARCLALGLEGRDLELRIARPSGGIAAVSIDLAHEAGTATPGVDYLAPADQTLAWAPGDLHPKSIVVPILSDGPGEAVETFRLRLSNAQPEGVSIQPSELLEVRILDGDDQGFADGFEGDCPS